MNIANIWPNPVKTNARRTPSQTTNDPPAVIPPSVETKANGAMGKSHGAAVKAQRAVKRRQHYTGQGLAQFEQHHKRKNRNRPFPAQQIPKRSHHGMHKLGGKSGCALMLLGRRRLRSRKGHGKRKAGKHGHQRKRAVPAEKIRKLDGQSPGNQQPGTITPDIGRQRRALQSAGKISMRQASTTISWLAERKASNAASNRNSRRD